MKLKEIERTIKEVIKKQDLDNFGNSYATKNGSELILSRDKNKVVLKCIDVNNIVRNFDFIKEDSKKAIKEGMLNILLN